MARFWDENTPQEITILMKRYDFCSRLVRAHAARTIWRSSSGQKRREPQSNPQSPASNIAMVDRNTIAEKTIRSTRSSANAALCLCSLTKATPSSRFHFAFKDPGSRPEPQWPHDQRRMRLRRAGVSGTFQVRELLPDSLIPTYLEASLQHTSQVIQSGDRWKNLKLISNQQSKMSMWPNQENKYCENQLPILAAYLGLKTKPRALKYRQSIIVITEVVFHKRWVVNTCKYCTKKNVR